MSRALPRDDVVQLSLLQQFATLGATPLIPKLAQLESDSAVPVNVRWQKCDSYCNLDLLRPVHFEKLVRSDREIVRGASASHDVAGVRCVVNPGLNE